MLLDPPQVCDPRSTLEEFMKKALLLSAVLLVAASGFADTIINNFTGYNDGWGAFGDTGRSTQTYGEVFTVPDGENYLNSFSFYTGGPFDPGDIVAGAYVATWTGTKAGQLLYDSGQFTYDNAGNETLGFSTGGIVVHPGEQYIMFLSTSKFHGQSDGSTYFSAGDSNANLNGFAYFNNGGSFDGLFFSDWEAIGLFPDLAVNLEFTSVPEPSSLVLVCTGVLGLTSVLRRKF
jgi:hypothetical protein